MSRILLVSSHPRSGTHFLIDSILRNAPESKFPYLSCGDLNLQKLFWKNETALIEIEALLNQHKSDVLIIKSHASPSEVARFIEDSKASYAAKEAVRLVWGSSEKVYLFREAKATLTSFWRYSDPQGKLSFAEFVNAPHHWVQAGGIVTLANVDKRDFYRKHLEEWGELASLESVRCVDYQDLLSNHSTVMTSLFDQMNLECAETEIVVPRKLDSRGPIEKLRWWAYKRGLPWAVQSTNPHVDGRSSRKPDSETLKSIDDELWAPYLQLRRLAERCGSS
jgi:hypothetical protein